MNNQTFKPPLPVLIVEDNQAVVEVVDLLLRRNGFKTAIAITGQEAIDWLKKRETSIVLTDHNLPDMQGWEIIETIRQDTTHNAPPFLVMTGEGDERIAVEMMKRGALDYVVKDADFNTRLPAALSRATKQLEQAEKLASVEAALKREHQFLSAIVETTGALVVVLDKNGIIIRFNRACERITGYSAREMIGQPVWQLIRRVEEIPSTRDTFNRLAQGQ